MEGYIKKSLLQIIVILLLASLSGIIFNRIRGHKVPHPITQIKGLASSRENIRNISSEVAFSYLTSRRAIFIDARSQEQYNEGHIRGAISIPYENLEKYYETLIKEIPPDKFIIVYCGSRSCQLSMMLAKELIQMGYSNVMVLKGGWKEWKKLNLPVTLKNK